MRNVNIYSKYFVGNTPIINFLFSTKNRGISHAVLLYGEKGLGKKTLGKLLAAKIISEKENFIETNVGRMVLNNIHPDFLLYEKEKGIRVDDVRDIIKKTNILPHQSNVRVCMLCDCDNMTVQAQNALLKTLEEPPKSSRFILTARSKTSLLETIESRLESFKLAPVDIYDGVEYLEEKYKVTSENAVKAMEKSSGNIGRALEFLEISKKNTAFEKAVKIVLAITEGSRYNVLARFYEVGSREEYLEVLDEILKIVSEIILYKNAKDKKEIMVYKNNLNYKEISKKTSNSSLINIVKEITKVKKNWVYNPNLQLCSSQLAIRLTNN